MNRLFAAVAVATAMSAGVASAQSDTMTMDVGISMLELAASKQLAMIGINDVDTMALTLNQLAQIKAVLESGDYNTQQKTSQVGTIVANN